MEAPAALIGRHSGVGEPIQADHTAGSSRPRLLRVTAFIVLGLLLVGLRIVALNSDPYLRLDWSAGLLTDEGFYVHNARNVVLFGHAHTDEFNNMLLSPLLHYAQAGVFTVFGAGAIQARMISVVCSLLTLTLLYAALRRAFDNRIALTSVIFLGLDHCGLLYSRMALMDIPASLPAVAAFLAFVRARECGSGSVSREDAKALSDSAKWFGICGILLGVTAVSRMLCAYLLPVPFIALQLGGGRASKREQTGASVMRRGWVLIASGLAAVCVLYVCFWYLPHRAEIAPMNAYYRAHQIQPRSIIHLLENIRHAVVGDFRGIAPYLFRHTPILFALTLALLCATVARGRNPESDEPNVSDSVDSAALRYLIAWLLLGWAMLAVISYSPSRYYVTTYPAFAALAAIGLWRLPDMLKALGAPLPRARIARGLLASSLTFHALLSVVHYGGTLPRLATTVVLYGFPLAVALAVACARFEKHLIGCHTNRFIMAACAAWALVNCLWLVDWSRRLAYTQTEMSHWLADSLPIGSVLIGDVAPGLSLDNPFRAIHVQPGLVNDRQPVERYAGAPRYIVILDGRWKERYWLNHYPQLVDPARRIKLAHVMRWDVGVYSVDMPPVVASVASSNASSKDSHVEIR